MLAARTLRGDTLFIWLISLCDANFIYDTRSDPLETINLLDDPSIADVQTELEERFAFFQTVDFTKDEVDLTGSGEIWSAAGGVTPLNDLDEAEKDVIAVGIPAEEAPNIVMILLDDVGLNDVNLDHTSTWLDFATPNMDRIASMGVVLANHYSAWVCGPCRASFLTGRYPYRLGYGEVPGTGEVNLPLGESTLAQELVENGYRTALIGKWHLGLQTWAHTPLFRGFDRFYGYYSGSVGYFSKEAQSGFLDLQDDLGVVTAANETSLSMHLTHLLQAKAEDAIYTHAATYPDLPLFLYYALENVHTGASEGFEAPQEYLDMCTQAAGDDDDGDDGDTYDLQAYCALVVMMDEAIGDTLCALEGAGMGDNTVLVVASDNGGFGNVASSSYPFRGNKGSYVQGGVKTAAFLYAGPALLPDVARGTTYYGLMHISDWYPTFLGLASGGEWDGVPMSGNELDSHDMFAAIVTNASSPRLELFVNWDASRADGAMQVGDYRYIFGSNPGVAEGGVVFEAGSTITEAATCSFEILETVDTSMWSILSLGSYSYSLSMQ